MHEGAAAFSSIEHCSNNTGCYGIHRGMAVCEEDGTRVDVSYLRSNRLYVVLHIFHATGFPEIPAMDNCQYNYFRGG